MAGSPVRGHLVWILHSSTFFFFLGIALVNPLVSPISIDLGAKPFVVGVVAAVASVFSLTFKPLGGLLGDRGLKMHVMMVGSLSGVLAGVFYTLSTMTGNLILFGVGRALHGFGMAMFFPSSLSASIDLAPSGRVGETLGWRGVMFSMGNLIGPAMGGFMADSIGFVPTFVAAAVFSFVSLVLIRVARSGEITDRVHLKTMGEGRYRELSRPFFVTACMALFLMAFSYGGLYAYLPALYKSMGLKASEFGIYASIIGGSSLLMRIIGGRGADRLGAAPIASMGLASVVASYFLLNLYLTPPKSYVSAILLGVGFGVAAPSLQMMALAKLPRGVRTFGSGVYTMFFDLGNMTGPVALGYVAQSGGYEAVFPVLPWPIVMGLVGVQVTALRWSRKGKCI